MHFVGIGGEQNHDYIFEGEIPLEHISEPGPDGRPFEFRFMVRAEIKKEGESGYGFVWLEQRNRSGTNPEGDGKIIVLPPERTPEESLDAIHAVALPQLQAAIATSGSKILVSKSLLSDEDMVALGTALNKDIVEIIDPTDMLHRATNTNAGTNPGTLACVMSRLDFETLKAKGLTQHNNRSTLLVLEEDLKDVRYLYTEGVIGMARAMMVKDMQKAIAYRDLLFGPSVNNEMLNKLLQGDQVVFFNELTDVFRFKPIIAIDTSHLPEYKVIMENYLRQA